MNTVRRSRFVIYVAGDDGNFDAVYRVGQSKRAVVKYTGFVSDENVCDSVEVAVKSVCFFQTVEFNVFRAYYGAARFRLHNRRGLVYRIFHHVGKVNRLRYSEPFEVTAERVRTDCGKGGRNSDRLESAVYHRAVENFGYAFGYNELEVEHFVAFITFFSRRYRRAFEIADYRDKSCSVRFVCRRVRRIQRVNDVFVGLSVVLSGKSNGFYLVIRRFRTGKVKFYAFESGKASEYVFAHSVEVGRVGDDEFLNSIIVGFHTDCGNYRAADLVGDIQRIVFHAFRKGESAYRNRSGSGRNGFERCAVVVFLRRVLNFVCVILSVYFKVARNYVRIFETFFRRIVRYFYPVHKRVGVVAVGNVRRFGQVAFNEIFFSYRIDLVVVVCRNDFGQRSRNVEVPFVLNPVISVTELLAFDVLNDFFRRIESDSLFDRRGEYRFARSRIRYILRKNFDRRDFRLFRFRGTFVYVKVPVDFVKIARCVLRGRALFERVKRVCSDRNQPGSEVDYGKAVNSVERRRTDFRHAVGDRVSVVAYSYAVFVRNFGAKRGVHKRFVADFFQSVGKNRRLKVHKISKRSRSDDLKVAAELYRRERDATDERVFAYFRYAFGKFDFGNVLNSGVGKRSVSDYRNSVRNDNRHLAGFREYVKRVFADNVFYEYAAEHERGVFVFLFRLVRFVPERVFESGRKLAVKHGQFADSVRFDFGEKRAFRDRVYSERSNACGKFYLSKFYVFVERFVCQSSKFGSRQVCVFECGTTVEHAPCHTFYRRRQNDGDYLAVLERECSDGLQRGRADIDRGERSVCKRFVFDCRNAFGNRDRGRAGNVVVFKETRS